MIEINFDSFLEQVRDIVIPLASSYCIDKLKNNETIQRVLRQFKLEGESNDFQTRYIETIVEVDFMNKADKILPIFGEKTVIEAYYYYYYDTSNSLEQKQVILKNTISNFFESMDIDNKLKADHINIHEEIESFHKVFQRKIHESRPVKDAELYQQLLFIRADVENLSQKLEDHAKPIIDHTLTHNPIVPEVFFGRENDLAYIHDNFFTTDSNILILHGEGGVGKTSLASRYFEIYKSKYAHVAWITSNSNLSDALLTLARPLGLEIEEFQQRVNPENRIENLLTKMCNLAKPCLLVIDNVNSIEELDYYYDKLGCCSNFHVIFTTRIFDNFSNVKFYQITPLPEDLALEIFRIYYQSLQPTDESYFKKLYHRVGGNTLVLELFAKNLNELNDSLEISYPLETLIEDVERGLLQLSKTEKVKVHYHNLRRATPEEIIRAMYKISILKPEQADLLAIFAALPPERIVYTELKEILQQKNLHEVLRSLKKRGWLNFEEDNKIYCSPIVQAAIRREHKNWKSECEILVQGLLQKLDSYPIHEISTLRTTYTHYAETVCVVLDTLDSNLAWLCCSVGKFHTTVGNLHKAQEAFERMEQVFSDLLKKDPDNPYHKKGLSTSYLHTGQIYTYLGDYDKSLQFFWKNNELVTELYEKNANNSDLKNTLSISYMRIGQAYSNKKDFQKALDYFTKCHEIKKSLHESEPDNEQYKSGFAISFDKLGQTYSNLRQKNKAQEYFEEFNKIQKELFNSKPNNKLYINNLATSYEKLGQAYCDMNNNNEALRLLWKSHRLRNKIYKENPENVEFKNNLATSYNKLGQIYLKLDKGSRANNFFKKQCLISRELSEAYPNTSLFRENFISAKQNLSPELHFMI